MYIFVINLLNLSNFLSFICSLSLHFYSVWQRRLLYIRKFWEIEKKCDSQFFFFYQAKYFKSREVDESTTVIFQLSSLAFYFLWVSQLLKNVVNIPVFIISTGSMVEKFINFRICHNWSWIDKKCQVLNWKTVRMIWFHLTQKVKKICRYKELVGLWEVYVAIKPSSFL
jgi:hypothetical protein